MNKSLVITKIQKVIAKPIPVEMEPTERKCSNGTFECSLTPEENYEYCIKHILQDSSAPYKQCTFVFTNGKQCTQAKLAEDRKDPK